MGCRDLKDGRRVFRPSATGLMSSLQPHELIAIFLSHAGQMVSCVLEKYDSTEQVKNLSDMENIEVFEFH